MRTKPYVSLITVCNLILKNGRKMNYRNSKKSYLSDSVIFAFYAYDIVQIKGLLFSFAFMSRGYRDNIDPKSGFFFRSLNLIPNPRGGGGGGGVDHRTVAQESRAAPAARAPDSAGQRRTASGSIRSAGQRSGIAEISVSLAVRDISQPF